MKKCPFCAEEIQDSAIKCKHCGSNLYAQEPPRRSSSSGQGKSKITAGLLALFLGGLGIHKFYLGKSIGVLYLIFFWTFIPAIVALVDAIILLTMTDENFDRMYNQ
ncbi:MAG: NINE protein [Candidatus Parcubacteria bacterium]|nr:NINE protein [Candidatus Parcubacteria bacterium]